MLGPKGGTRHSSNLGVWFKGGARRGGALVWGWGLKVGGTECRSGVESRRWGLVDKELGE